MLTYFCSSINHISLLYAPSRSYHVQLMRKVDANHDGSIAVNEFITTLIDWNQMQALGEWQVRDNLGAPQPFSVVFIQS